MSRQSERLRNRAADQLRAARRNKTADEKTQHSIRAAALKEMAHNEEWLNGDRERSRKRATKKRKGA